MHKLVQIIDNGNGISSEQTSKMFSPFFSTKPNGQGVGLMLIRKILNNHDLKYGLYSDHSGFTYFDIQF